MSTTDRPIADATVGVRVSAAEKAQLEADARAEGVSVSTLIYRRTFNKPDARRPQGRRPKHDPSADEAIDGLLMTG